MVWARAAGGALKLVFTVAGWGRRGAPNETCSSIFRSWGRDLSAFLGGVTSQTREFYVPSKHGQLSNITLSAALEVYVELH